MIRILVVEDHALVANMLRMSLDAHESISVVDVVGTCREARAALATHQPDVLLTDFELPDGPGTSLVGPHHATLLISGVDDVRACDAAVATGCSGFLSKGRPLDELVAALQVVAGGGSVFPAASIRRSSNIDESTDALTERELEVLRGLASAKSVADIAAEHHIAVNTVRNHVRSLLTKLGARSQLEAVVIAVRNGLVSID